MKKNIGIVGAGSWGTALAVLLANNGHDVCVWSYNSAEVLELSHSYENKKKLPGVIIPHSVMFTDDITLAIKEKDVVITAVPSIHIKNTAKMISQYIPDGQIIVNASKGIDSKTLMTISAQINAEVPQAKVAVLSGPSHAEEVGKGLPTTCVVGADDNETAQLLQEIFNSDVFRVYTSTDVIGIEIGAALKNVIALAAGIADGLGYGDNTKAALITRGIAEISRLGIKMGGKPETFAGLAGIGDLIVTCASQHSRNRKAGVLIGQGMTAEDAMKEVQMVVEGVYSARAALALARKYDESMPIVEQINEVLFSNKSPAAAVKELMMRDCRPEHRNLR